MAFEIAKCGKYFDQEDPERPLKGLIADEDQSACYELDATAVFAVDPTGFLVVHVSGCSCWPDRGATTQTYCEDRVAVHRLLAGGNWSGLIQACQDARWEPK